MATLYIASKADVAKSQRIEALIDNGEMPHPPALEGKQNQCANPKCGKMTMFARFYVPRIGYCCQECFDDWRTTPVWCSTRADDVHIGRVHIIPQCIIDNDAALEIKTSAEGKHTVATRSAESGDIGDSWVANRVAYIRSKRSEELQSAEDRWHDARRAGAERRGAVVARLA